MTTVSKWCPPDYGNPDYGRLGEIKALFEEIYPQGDYGSLANDISRYWIDKLETIWNEKAPAIKALDMEYDPADPLSRVAQKIVIIAYADSVHQKGRATLETLHDFLKTHFPAVSGLHLLPSCEIAETRFNDGGFSQIRRDRVHRPYGTNKQFEKMMAEYFSMTDLVLNHVDIDHPVFKRYLDGDDAAGRCFFVYREDEYQKRLKKGDFEHIFRPRPFPLFTIFRRCPEGDSANLSQTEKLAVLNRLFEDHHLAPLPDEVLKILSVFHKVKNDQMLLTEDYDALNAFLTFVYSLGKALADEIFTISITQETQETPYIFKPVIDTPIDLLKLLFPYLTLPIDHASAYSEIFAANDTRLFGEPIRALTTFSHVQVDLNTTSLEGLQLLIDDFAWYLKMDLNMLRLDAANFAFKKWGTSCFGLPEVRKLLKVLYLSMDCVAPRNIPNLEVNAPLSAVLKQMADTNAPPPMMYDFHLASMLPVVFNTRDARPLLGIRQLIGQYQIPHESIRFSLDESHDGKSINGSGGADPLLTYRQRAQLVEIVKQNGGHVKYKSSTPRSYPQAEFDKVCREAQLDRHAAGVALFEAFSADDPVHTLKSEIETKADLARALQLTVEQIDQDPALTFFADKIIQGREPYELCAATRDALYKIEDPQQEVDRYLAFKVLALALMGRHVKALYFNDLLGLPNNHALVAQTGELRNIKRTKSDLKQLVERLADKRCIERRIAGRLNNLIAIVDADPAFDPRGTEALLTVDERHPAVARVVSRCADQVTLVIVNISDEVQDVALNLSDFDLNTDAPLIDQIDGKPFTRKGFSGFAGTCRLAPFAYLWLKNNQISITPTKIVA